MVGDLVDRRLRLLIVDDSAFNRKLLTALFADRPEIEVVGTAADGEEALRLLGTLEPDVMTLDLEMPKMDGFTFLRIALAKRNIPIVVVSSYAQRENVFRALELGAVDFVTKAQSTIDAGAEELKQEIVAKVLAVRSANLRESRRISQRKLVDASSTAKLPAIVDVGKIPKRLIAIASSTGGPGALLEIVAALPAEYPHAVLIAQHMPEKFTRTFAERLGKRGKLHSTEATDGERVVAGTIRVCPGGYVLEVERVASGGFITRVQRPSPEDRYIPSGDRLFASVARAAGREAIGVVLTGMGDDGLKGARWMKASGGLIVAESEASAVVNGMPGAIVRAGLATEVLAVDQIGDYLAKL
jgi:two-component system, chemotaxis family, protein-glutamate methylesterase/glutaminase